MFDVSKLSEMEIDALKELGNIGAGHAANALSQMLGRYISMTVPEVEILEISKLEEKFGEEVVAGILTALQDLEANNSGFLYVMFPMDSSKKLIKTLCGSEDIDEMGISALMEVGNILSSSFCNATAEFLNIIMLPSPPNFAMDMTIAVIDAIAAQLAEKSDYIILFETKLHDGEELSAYLVLIPDMKFFENIMELLRGMQ